MNCRACDQSPAISEGVPFCSRCWRVIPKVTREAFARGEASAKRVAHLINERRTPARKLHEGRYSGINWKRG